MHSSVSLRLTSSTDSTKRAGSSAAGAGSVEWRELLGGTVSAVGGVRESLCVYVNPSLRKPIMNCVLGVFMSV